MIDLSKIKKINNPEYMQQQIELIEKINKFKGFLYSSDYKFLPDYDKPVPEDLISKRQEWREEVRQLEIELENLKSQ